MKFLLPTAIPAAGICRFSAARSICVGGIIIADVAEFGRRFFGLWVRVPPSAPSKFPLVAQWQSEVSIRPKQVFDSPREDQDATSRPFHATRRPAHASTRETCRSDTNRGGSPPQPSSRWTRSLKPPAWAGTGLLTQRQEVRSFPGPPWTSSQAVDGIGLLTRRASSPALVRIQPRPPISGHALVAEMVDALR
jgi:hypothetical protein